MLIRFNLENIYAYCNELRICGYQNYFIKVSNHSFFGRHRITTTHKIEPHSDGYARLAFKVYEELRDRFHVAVDEPKLNLRVHSVENLIGFFCLSNGNLYDFLKAWAEIPSESMHKRERRAFIREIKLKAEELDNLYKADMVMLSKSIDSDTIYFTAPTSPYASSLDSVSMKARTSDSESIDWSRYQNEGRYTPLMQNKYPVCFDLPEALRAILISKNLLSETHTPKLHPRKFDIED